MHQEVEGDNAVFTIESTPKPGAAVSWVQLLQRVRADGLPREIQYNCKSDERRSGSGKSTLLNIVGALETIDSGEVLVCGENIKAWDTDQRADFQLRHMGFIFQAHNLIRVLTARENVAYVCQLQGRSRGECMELADYWLEQVGIGYLGYRRPDQLSGGQQQRVAVARALAMNPELVLADEPTANVDSKTGRDLIALVHSLNERFETTFVISSHDPVVIDAAGRLVQIEGRSRMAASSARLPQTSQGNRLHGYVRTNTGR